MAVILRLMKRALVPLKVEDNERVRKLILTSCLTTENTVFNLSKHLVVI